VAWEQLQINKYGDSKPLLERREDFPGTARKHGHIRKTLHLSLLEPDTRSFIVEKLYPSLLKNGYDPAERLRSRAYWPVKAFHAPNSAARYT
jgi:hypothetical protein